VLKEEENKIIAQATTHMDDQGNFADDKVKGSFTWPIIL